MHETCQPVGLEKRSAGFWGAEVVPVQGVAARRACVTGSRLRSQERLEGASRDCHAVLKDLTLKSNGEDSFPPKKIEKIRRRYQESFFFK